MNVDLSFCNIVDFVETRELFNLRLMNKQANQLICQSPDLKKREAIDNFFNSIQIEKDDYENLKKHKYYKQRKVEINGKTFVLNLPEFLHHFMIRKIIRKKLEQAHATCKYRSAIYASYLVNDFESKGLTEKFKILFDSFLFKDIFLYLTSSDFILLKFSIYSQIAKDKFFKNWVNVNEIKGFDSIKEKIGSNLLITKPIHYLLLWAANKGDVHLTQHILKEKIEESFKNDALKIAGGKGKEKYAKLLNSALEKPSHQKALEEAVRTHQWDSIRSLISTTCPKEDLLLQYLTLASENGNLETVKFIYGYIDNSSNSKDKCSNALFFAAKEGHLPIVEFFISKNPSQQALEKALWNASYQGRLEVVKRILEFKIADKAIDESMFIAGQRKHFSLFKFYLEKKPSKQAIQLALSQATREKNFEVVRLLKSHLKV